MINTRFQLFRSSASFFSSQYLLLFRKSLRNCFSSSYSFHFRHLFFNGIIKKAISCKITTNSIGFSRQILFNSVLFLEYHLHFQYKVVLCTLNNVRRKEENYAKSNEYEHLLKEHCHAICCTNKGKLPTTHTEVGNAFPRQIRAIKTDFNSRHTT